MKSSTNRELLDNLTRAGFQTYLGPDGAGLLMLIFQSGGGFYIGKPHPSFSLLDLRRVDGSDTGASQEIIDGNIKVKRGSVRRFTERGVEVDDSLLEADLVVFATG